MDVVCLRTYVQAIPTSTPLWFMHQLARHGKESNTMSPMLKRINHIAAMHTDDTLLCLACGVVFAALTIAFFI